MLRRIGATLDHGTSFIPDLENPSFLISRLLELFLAYEEDHNVKLIILKGKGRAFCAGGDVAAVVRDIKEGRDLFLAFHMCNWKLGAKYFWKEFILNYVMATYNKPQVSILYGIVMGGGAGASIHGRFRVATENSVFSMPETALGLFPDVGASYYLSRLPGFFGHFGTWYGYGVVGARLDGAEMVACGFATHFVPAERLPMLEEALNKVDSGDPTVIFGIISEFSQYPNLKEKSAYYRMDIIDRCFSRRTVEDILSALEIEAKNSKDDWISTTLQSLKKASPMSLKISLRSWNPSKLEQISDEMVDCYFSKVDDEEWEDLKLPPRSNLPAHAIAKL
ncbi:hypothetical protein LguiB_012589 [Lonicera macranthoides]